MLQISITVLSRERQSELDNMGDYERKQTKKGKKINQKRQGVHLGRFSGLFSWSHSPLEGCAGPIGDSGLENNA